jgi:hypothetical protein
MAQLTTDKITEIYCIADDFCKEFSKVTQKHQILPDDGKRHRNRIFILSKNVRREDAAPSPGGVLPRPGVETDCNPSLRTFLDKI